MKKHAMPQRRNSVGCPSGRTLLLSSVLLSTPLVALAQEAPAPKPDEQPVAHRAAPSAVEVASQPKAAEEELVVLSPFEVVGETRGYQATNTMSGTRFNTKLEDLASSITVMTKTQMSDFAMLDLNDVFLYVAGTEGSGTYTDYTLDRNGSVSDNVQINPTQANRVRGLAPANVALNNIETMGRVPVDPILIDALEVSRGANANVFGLGNPSGTVNQVAASANLNRNKGASEIRYDSYGGRRASVDWNQVLIKGKLAIRGSAVLQKEEFERKPSGVTTERYNGMIKFQPFKYTTISGSIFYYHAYGNRPNSLPPRDNISYWVSQGMPTWDPVHGIVHNADGSTLMTVAAGSSFPSNFPFATSYLGAQASQLFIDQSGITYWGSPRGTTSSTDPTASQVATRAYVQPLAAYGVGSTSGRPITGADGNIDPRLFLQSTTPTISDKSIYDWSEINLSAPNSFWDRTTTYNLALDQIFIDSAKQTLAAQVAFMREDSERWTRSLIGISNDNGQSGQLTIDVNEYLLDGSVNPNFLRPYISVDRPRIVYQPATWDTARAQLAYRLDLTQEKGWFKWLGSHNITAYGEYKHRVNRQYSWREGMTSEVSWLPTSATFAANGTASGVTYYRGFQSAPGLSPSLPLGYSLTTATNPSNVLKVSQLAQSAYRFYVGDKISVDGINVDYAPSDISYGTYTYSWMSNSTANWAPGSTTLPTVHTQSVTLGTIAADKTGGTFNTDTILRTAGAVMQSNFLENRLVATFGLRQDRVRTKFGYLGYQPWVGTYSAPASVAGTTYEGTLQNYYLNSDGMTFNYDVTDAWGSSYITKGNTTNAQLMLRPFLNLKFVTDLKQSNGSLNRFLGDLLNGLSIYGNRSSSFLPIAPSQDLYRNMLPNTTGKDKSWGIGLTLMEGKLYIRFTHYDNFQRNAQTTDLSTMAGRVLRMDLQTLGAGSPTPYINLHDVMSHAVSFVIANQNSHVDGVATNPTYAAAYPTYLPGSGETIEDVVTRLTGLSTADVDYFASANPPVAATVDTRSYGNEIEVNYNPTPFWTVSASVTDTRTVNQNVSAAMAQWLEERMPIWTTIVDPSISASGTTGNPTSANNPNKLWWLHHYTASTTTGNAVDWLATAYAPYTASAQTPQYNYMAFIAAPFTLMQSLDGKSNPQVRRYNVRLSTSYGLAGITDNKWLKKMTVGGAVRWEDKAAIGYMALDDFSALDTNRPIYDKEHYYFDAFVSYKMKLWNDKVAATFKINAKNIGQHGSLQPVGAFPNDTNTGYIVHTYRIRDPQQFILSAAFDF